MMHPPLEIKANLRLLMPVVGSNLRLAPVQTWSRSGPSRCLMRLSPTSWLNAPQCMMPVSSSQPPLQRTLHSHQSNALRLITYMENTSKKPMVHKCKQLPPEVTKDKTISLWAQTLLERMGLGNQTLMVRLRLPLKSSPNLTHATCFSPSLDLKGMVYPSNKPAMMMEMTRVTTHG